MATGTVKWFNATKGFGFIQPSDGGKDVFVHISAVERAGLSGLAEGQKISYEVKVDTKRGKSSAENLRVCWLATLIHRLRKPREKTGCASPKRKARGRWKRRKNRLSQSVKTWTDCVS